MDRFAPARLPSVLLVALSALAQPGSARAQEQPGRTRLWAVHEIVSPDTSYVSSDIGRVQRQAGDTLWFLPLGEDQARIYLFGPGSIRRDLWQSLDELAPHGTVVRIGNGRARREAFVTASRGDSLWVQVTRGAALGPEGVPWTWQAVTVPAGRSSGLGALKGAGIGGLIGVLAGVALGSSDSGWMGAYAVVLGGIGGLGGAVLGGLRGAGTWTELDGGAVVWTSPPSRE